MLKNSGRFTLRRLRVDFDWSGSVYPKTSIVPASAIACAVSNFIVVLLPAPLGPSNPTHVPTGTSKSSPSTAWMAPKCLRTPPKADRQSLFVFVRHRAAHASALVRARLTHIARCGPGNRRTSPNRSRCALRWPVARLRTSFRADVPHRGFPERRTRDPPMEHRAGAATLRS